MLLVAACTDKQTDGNTVSGLNPADFRMEVDGKQTYLFVLKNTNGMEVCITILYPFLLFLHPAQTASDILDS